MRYRPEIVWSSHSWTHNIFRAFEFVFGRKVGIRAESTTRPDGNGGTVVFVHTFEAAVAYAETYIRSLFALPKLKLVKIYIPVLSPVGAPVSPLGLPYLFTITFDTVDDATDNAATSVTWSHTCTGSGLSIIINGCQNAIPIASTSSATYNAVALTQVITDKNTSQNTWMDINVLASPATGANNAVWTANLSNVSAFAISLTGTLASPIGASATSEFSTSTTPTTAVTTTAANSWIVDNMQANAATVTATGTGQTKRTSFTGVGGNKFHGSTTTTTTTGSYNVSYSLSSAADGTLLVVEIKSDTSSPSASISPSPSSSTSASASSSVSSSASASQSPSSSASASVSPSPSASASSSASPSTSSSVSPSPSPTDWDNVNLSSALWVNQSKSN